MRTISFPLLALTAACAAMTTPSPGAPEAVAGPDRPPEARQAAPSPPAARAPAVRVAPARTAAAAPSPAPAAAPAPADRAPAPAVAKADAGPNLDLKGLERRLKETDAIGLFTKLALKNSVDDLLAKFRAYHGGRQPPTLTDLRPSYELLIMKVQSLVQKDDPALADDVTRSREAIWSVLADKSAFTSI